jgi:hypothetical protein
MRTCASVSRGDASDAAAALARALLATGHREGDEGDAVRVPVIARARAHSVAGAIIIVQCVGEIDRASIHACHTYRYTVPSTTARMSTKCRDMTHLGAAQLTTGAANTRALAPAARRGVAQYVSARKPPCACVGRRALSQCNQSSLPLYVCPPVRELTARM